MTSTPESDAPRGAQNDSPTELDATEVIENAEEIVENVAAREVAGEVVEVTEAIESAEEIVAAAEDAEEEDAADAVADAVADAEQIVDEATEPDPRLLAAHDLALAALHEITPASTVGPAADYALEPGGAVSLRFHNRLPGYPGWYWTVTLAVVSDAEPTVLEVELLPGAGALLAPDWVPWATRLAEYHAQQAAAAESADAADDEDEDDAEFDESGEDFEDGDEDADAADFDEDGSSILHAGDVDGVDIDELDESADDVDDADDDSDEDDDDADAENDAR